MNELPRHAPLALHLARSHHCDQRIKFVLGKIGADRPETPSYVFANCLFTEGVNLCQSGLAEDVLY